MMHHCIVFFCQRRSYERLLIFPKKKVGRTTENALLSKIVIEGKDMD